MEEWARPLDQVKKDKRYGFILRAVENYWKGLGSKGMTSHIRVTSVMNRDLYHKPALTSSDDMLKQAE